VPVGRNLGFVQSPGVEFCESVLVVFLRK
jgi:hypothetical protein